MKQKQVRLPDQVADDIDKRAAEVGLSRNQWIVRALVWALDQPVKTTTRTVKEKL